MSKKDIPDREDTMFSSEAHRQAYYKMLEDGPISTFRVEGRLNTAGYAHVPEPACGQQGCLCTNLSITLPSITTVQNLTTKVVAIRYFLGYHGSYPPGQVPGDTEGEWCKIYGASETWQQLANLRQQLVVTAQLKNWSDAYTCTGALEVDWCYSDPSPTSKEN